MHRDHDIFVAGIQTKTKVLITWISEDDGGVVQVRKCAPMDYAPWNRPNLIPNPPRYHLWDYDGQPQPHNLPPPTENIVSFEATADPFDPAEFVRWVPNWHVPRDWGQYG